MAKKQAAPKNILAPLKVRVAEKPVQNGEVLTVLVDGDYPSCYNEALAHSKKAEQLMKDIKPLMSPDALNFIFGQNAQKPYEPIASVAFQDDNGNVTRITFANKYSAVQVEAAEALFGSIKLRAKDGEEPKEADINDYLARIIVGTFDSTAFLGPDGKFDRARYTKIMGALDQVSAELGIKNPISTETAIKPLPSFHAKRWIDFDEATNRKISKVIQNQVAFSPCPNAKTGKMVGEEDEEDKKA